MFIQCVTKNTGDAFAGVEKIIWGKLPHLLFGKSKTLSSIIGYLSTMLVNKCGMGLLNPVTYVNKKPKF